MLAGEPKMALGNIVRKSMLGTLGLLFAAPMFAAGLASAEVADKKPNIVVALMDNLGWGELGVYGSGILRGAPTPRIDKLAAEGMRLLNFNVEAQCTPSRAALTTPSILPSAAYPSGSCGADPISVPINTAPATWSELAAKAKLPRAPIIWVFAG
jgi:hypothetical protein